MMARIDEREANGNAWQKPAIAALWAMVLLFGGWAWTDATNARGELENRTRASVERIATLEEAVRGLNRSLERIEAGVNELRRDQRK